KLHPRFAVRLPGYLPHDEAAGHLFQATLVHEWKRETRGWNRQRFVLLVDLTRLEERLVAAPKSGINAEHQHAGRIPIETMHRAERGQLKLAAQAHQRGVAQVAPARRAGHEVRLVDDQQAPV